MERFDADIGYSGFSDDARIPVAPFVNENECRVFVRVSEDYGFVTEFVHGSHGREGRDVEFPSVVFQGEEFSGVESVLVFRETQNVARKRSGLRYDRL